MTFEREERYIVVKLKDLTPDQKCQLRDTMMRLGIIQRECVVVESDWPEYEQVWDMIERRVTTQENANDRPA